MNMFLTLGGRIRCPNAKHNQNGPNNSVALLQWGTRRYAGSMGAYRPDLRLQQDEHAAQKWEQYTAETRDRSDVRAVGRVGSSMTSQC